jgi:hypothetical protein
MFLRGVDGTAGRDLDSGTRTALLTGGNAGNQVGSFQADAFKSHTHTENQTQYGGTGTGGGGFNWPNYTSLTNTGTTGGKETRPINTYVNYIIKL